MFLGLNSCKETKSYKKNMVFKLLKKKVCLNLVQINKFGDPVLLVMPYWLAYWFSNELLYPSPPVFNPTSQVSSFGRCFILQVLVSFFILNNLPVPDKCTYTAYSCSWRTNAVSEFYFIFKGIF